MTATKPPRRIVAIVNQKGGVGKTTTAINLAAELAVLNRKVLVIDVDPQHDATGSIGIDTTLLKHNTYDWLLPENEPPTPQDLSEAVVSTHIANFDILPSSNDLSSIEQDLLKIYPGDDNRFNRLNRLNKALKVFLTAYKYDYILIDCPPTLGTLSLNALIAADSVLIPMQCEKLSLDGLAEVYKTIGGVTKTANPRLVVDFVVMTMYDSRVSLSRAIHEEVKKIFSEYGHSDVVAETTIPRAIKFGETPGLGKVIGEVAKNSPGAIAYRNLAQEVIRKAEKPKPTTEVEEILNEITEEESNA